MNWFKWDNVRRSWGVWWMGAGVTMSGVTCGRRHLSVTRGTTRGMFCCKHMCRFLCVCFLAQINSCYHAAQHDAQLCFSFHQPAEWLTRCRAGLESVTPEHTRPAPSSWACRPLKVYEVKSCPRWCESLRSTTLVKCIMWPFETLLCWKITFFSLHTGENYLYKQPAVWSKWHLRRRTRFFVPLFVIIEAFQPQLNFWLCCSVTWTSLTVNFFSAHTVCVCMCVCALRRRLIANHAQTSRSVNWPASSRQL